MNKLMVGLLLIMLMSISNEGYACEWVRSRLAHQPVVVYQAPVVAAYAGPIVPVVVQQTVVYEPVMVPVTVWVPVAPVVEKRWWGWPNYYYGPYVRPTLIRY